MDDDVGSSPTTLIHVDTYQRQVQDRHSTHPAYSPLIDRHQSPVVLHMQVQLTKSSHPATIAQAELKPKVDPPVSSRPNLDIMFDGWETNSVKAMVLAMITDSTEDNLSQSYDESLEIAHIDSSSDLATSISNYLPPRVENRITTWLNDVVEQPHA